MLEEYANLLFEHSFVSSQDLKPIRDWKKGGVEELLDFMARKYDLMFHGSNVDFDKVVHPANFRGHACYDNQSQVPLRSAFHSNNGKNVKGGYLKLYNCSYAFNEVHTPEFQCSVQFVSRNVDLSEAKMDLLLREQIPQFTHEKGFIYIIKNNNEITKHHNRPEFVSDKPQDIILKLEVLREDFIYPVYFELVNTLKQYRILIK